MICRLTLYITLSFFLFSCGGGPLSEYDAANPDVVTPTPSVTEPITFRIKGATSINVNSQVRYTTIGGSETGITFSIVSGEGSIGSTTGIFFAGNNVGTTVIRATDGDSNTEDISVHNGGTGIYAVGGYDGSTMDDVEISFDGINWTTYLTVLPSSHGEAAMKVYKDELFFIGGHASSTKVFESNDGIVWINHPTAQPGIEWGNTAVLNGVLYYVAGAVNQVLTSTDPGNSWTSVNNLNAGGQAGEVFFYDNKLFHVNNGDVEWTSDGASWTAGFDVPVSKTFHAGTVFDNKMWLVGGTSASNNVWWSTDGDNWNEGDAYVTPTNRDDGEMVTFNSRMWYVAGSSSGLYTLDNLSSLDGDTWETHTGVMNLDRDRFAMEVFTDKTRAPNLSTLYFSNDTFTNDDFRGATYKNSNTTLFAASFGGGIQSSNDDGTTWTNFTTVDGLPSDNIYSVFIDSSDNLWASTDTGIGTSTDNGASWTNFDTSDGIISNTAYDIHVDRAGDLYVATDIGLSISTDAGTTWTNYTTADGLAENAINDIYVDFNYYIYVATDSGLSISKDAGTTWTTYTTTEGLGSNTVNHVTLSSSGIIYLATSGGLSISVDAGGTWRNIDTTLGLPSNDLVSVTIDNYGVIYASTASSGLAISVDETTNFETFTTNDGLGSNNPKHVVRSDTGTIYVGTDAGIEISQ